MRRIGEGPRVARLQARSSSCAGPRATTSSGSDPRTDARAVASIWPICQRSQTIIAPITSRPPFESSGGSIMRGRLSTMVAITSHYASLRIWKANAYPSRAAFQRELSTKLFWTLARRRLRDTPVPSSMHSTQHARDCSESSPGPCAARCRWRPRRIRSSLSRGRRQALNRRDAEHTPCHRRDRGRVRRTRERSTRWDPDPMQEFWLTRGRQARRRTPEREVATPAGHLLRYRVFDVRASQVRAGDGAAVCAGDMLGQACRCGAHHQVAHYGPVGNDLSRFCCPDCLSRQ